MILIAHRGNTHGRIPGAENSPDYIDQAIKMGYDVEIDVWLVNHSFYLGHDAPKYEVSYDWLIIRIAKLWVHCKNIECLSYFATTPLHHFWHETDIVTLTSKKYIWAFPGKQPIEGSIAVLPERSNEDISQCVGVCSDVIVDYCAEPKWKDDNLNIVIPMAGAGTRFVAAGYTFPKPLIEVRGKPMIQVVIENINIDANYIYIVQKSHREKYNLDKLLRLLTPKCTVLEVDGMTEGAACTVLLAKDYINNSNPLFFANSDQYVQWSSSKFMHTMNTTRTDGGILTFTSTHPKWSFVKVNEDGLVTEVAEKNPISNIATVGFYWWKRGSYFVKYAEQMIEKNIRFNNEFYVCPVFNEAIADGKKIRTFHIDEMWGLGTPEDLNAYLNQKSK